MSGNADNRTRNRWFPSGSRNALEDSLSLWHRTRTSGGDHSMGGEELSAFQVLLNLRPLVLVTRASLLGLFPPNVQSAVMSRWSEMLVNPVSCLSNLFIRWCIHGRHKSNAVAWQPLKMDVLSRRGHWLCLNPTWISRMELTCHVWVVALGQYVLHTGKRTQGKDAGLWFCIFSTNKQHVHSF